MCYCTLVYLTQATRLSGWVGFVFGGFFVRTLNCRSLAVRESCSILQAKHVLYEKIRVGVCQLQLESSESGFREVLDLLVHFR